MIAPPDDLRLGPLRPCADYAGSLLIGKAEMPRRRANFVRGRETRYKAAEQAFL